VMSRYVFVVAVLRVLLKTLTVPVCSTTKSLLLLVGSGYMPTGLLKVKSGNAGVTLYWFRVCPVACASHKAEVISKLAIVRGRIIFWFNYDS